MLQRIPQFGPKQFYKSINTLEFISPCYNNKDNKWYWNVDTNISGGGSAESLACYSTESSLIEAVHKSNIPVLTGIGHSSDKILLNSIADYHTNTPADAANFISSEYHKYQCNNQYKKSTKPTSRTITNNLKIILNEFLYKIKTFIK